MGQTGSSDRIIESRHKWHVTRTLNFLVSHGFTNKYTLQFIKSFSNPIFHLNNFTLQYNYNDYLNSVLVTDRVNFKL